MMEQGSWIRIAEPAPGAAPAPDHDAAGNVWWPRGGERRIGWRLLVVGPEHPCWEADACDAMRRTERAAPHRAAAQIGSLARGDVVWLTAADTVESETLAQIVRAVGDSDCGLLCETSLAALDRVSAAIPDSLRAEYLVDADTTDRRIALAAARRIPASHVSEDARDAAMERIDRLQDEVARIARLLDTLAGQRGLAGTPAEPGLASTRPGDALHSPPRDYAGMPHGFECDARTIERQRAKAVRRMLRQRRMRDQYFPADLFADPSWDMLLDLYAARLERQPVSVSSLCIAAAVPATTALRWIKTMTDAGLFLREADPHDGRRIFIGLAESAYDALVRYFEALEE